MPKRKADRLFTIIVFLLVAVGFIIFTSASLGLVSKNSNAFFQHVALKQFLLLLSGLLAMILVSNVNYKKIRPWAFWLFLLSLLATLAVFIPGIGINIYGARRWIDLGITTFQPAELLKFAYIAYLACWLSLNKEKIGNYLYGLLPFIVITGLVAAVLIAQPDAGSFLIIFITGVAMFIMAGARWSHILLLFLIICLSVAGMAFYKPYFRARLISFANPSDTLGSSYQLNQSLIAIGSGGLIGRGFGQSVQKFNYLPQQIGDSIFAVAAEEFGFVGSSILILIFALFALLGLKIASRSPDAFGGLMAGGIVIIMITQSFINMASMMGLMPLTGEPLLFVSQGGSSLVIALIEIGIVLNISKYIKQT